jgi:hypothetical protein
MSRTCARDCRQPGPSHCHCAAASCHATFASLEAFDDHRRNGQCLNPASLGLVAVDGLWASPERHANNQRSAAVLATARSSR